jgi:hypothetical protein
MAITNDLLSSTLYSIRESFVDELYKKVPFLDHARTMGGIEMEDGGIKIQRPLALAEHSSITQLPTGYEPVNIAVSDPLRPAVYDWCDYVAPVVITQKEELENRGAKAIIKILEARTKSVFGLLKRECNKQILGNASLILTDLNTLNGNTGGSGSATGFLEENDVGLQTNVIGGISKATYAATRGWQNQVGNAAGAFSTNGLAAMNQIYLNANAVAPMGDIGLIIASIDAMANYKRVLQAQERYIDPKVLDGGRMALAFAGALVEQDADMPANAGGAANDEYSMYFINFDALKLVIMEDADYAISDFVHDIGSTARVAKVYHKEQLIADHLGSLGVLYGGNTY